ncbi:MAG: FimV/HubP family polar landmark protein [Polaromonas sp.]
MNNRTHWRFGALASAIALLGSLASLDAHALALGQITVQSALGESLRAEIDIADINADEASSLKAGVASAEAFKAAGFEYTSVIAGLEVNLQRRADGRSYLRLTSNRPVTEPFMDLILQAIWSTGRITRDYTMLFDPPSLQPRRAGAAATPAAPIILARPTPVATPPARALVAPPSAPPSARATRPAPVASTPSPGASIAGKPSVGNKQVTVKTGDTAGQIAAQNKPSSVSLDQMLLALLTSNPDAFIGGNVNRVKSGAVLDIPDEQAASAVSSSEANQIIIAQSKDFNAFRRKLAQSVPDTQVVAADRQASGKVQAKVEDRTPASSAPDKLTLSKGAVQGKTASAAEDKIARDKQAQEAATRVTELSKNISDLNKLGATAAPTAPATSDSSAKVPGVALPLPAPTVPGSASDRTEPVAAAAPASATTSVAAPLATASQPDSAVVASTAAQAEAKKPAVAARAPSPEPSLIDGLLENPLLLPLGGGLLALLAGLGFYRYRQRGGAQVDSSFLESRLQPDSFFGASGGQRIDTNDGNITGSSLVYSPSQLDAAGDVDPVAEADVYLAYGRDLQAEEILKEALRTSPRRVAIHAKLLEIYAKRRDNKAFNTVAIEAFNLTRGEGPEWAYINEMGRELDPANPMYQPGGQPVGASLVGDAAAFNPSGAPSQDAQAASPAPAPASAPVVDVDVDLDLDLSLDDEPDMATAPAAIAAHLPEAPRQAAAESAQAISSAPALDDPDINFGSAAISPPKEFSTTSASRPVDAPAPDISFPSDDGPSFTQEPFVAAKPVATPSTDAQAPTIASAADSGMLEFDLASLSLDLTGPTTESPAHALTPMSDDPLETRFLLAEEFRSLGDAEGARSLAEEVLAKARGPLKVKAQAFLNALA